MKTRQRRHLNTAVGVHSYPLADSSQVFDEEAGDGGEEAASQVGQSGLQQVENAVKDGHLARQVGAPQPPLNQLYHLLRRGCVLQQIYKSISSYGLPVSLSEWSLPYAI